MRTQILPQINASLTHQAAKRELKEETGLAAGRVLGESPPVAMDPGMSSAMLSILTLEVDGDKEENVAAVKDLQAGDFFIWGH